MYIRELTMYSLYNNVRKKVKYESLLREQREHFVSVEFVYFPSALLVFLIKNAFGF